MKQESFSEMEYSYRKKKTKREEFLEIMDEIIPWDEWVGIIRPYYPAGKRGRLPRVSDNAIDWERTIENRKSAVRCKVEHPYRIVKNIFGFRKTVYRGLRKNLNRLHVLFASANLYIFARAGGSLRPAWGSCAL